MIKEKIKCPTCKALLAYSLSKLHHMMDIENYRIAIESMEKIEREKQSKEWNCKGCGTVFVSLSGTVISNEDEKSV